MKTFVEQLKALLPEGTELSDEFETKLVASFETAVAQRVQEQVEDVSNKAEEYAAYCKSEVEAIQEKANEYAEYVVEQMTQKVEDYAAHIVEQFVSEHQERMVETAEYNRMRTVFNLMKEAFEVNFFGLTNEPANEKLAADLKETKQEYNRLFKEHNQLRRQISDYDEYVTEQNKAAIFAEITADLADTQKERLERMVESANFSTTESYREGVTMMVEQLVAKVEDKKTEEDDKKIDEGKKADDDKVVPITESSEERMNRYLKAF